MTLKNAETLKAAKTAIKMGDKDQARVLLMQAARQDPDDHHPWLMLAGLAPSQKTALSYLDRAEVLNPADPTIEQARNWIDNKYGGKDPTAPGLSFTAVLSQRDLGWTALGAILLTLLILVTAWLPWLSPARWVLGFAFVLFVPGYWLTNALFPSREDIDGIERVGLSLGLSIACVSILTLILDRLPWGIRLWPIVISEGIFIVIFSLIAWFRRSRLPESERFLLSIDVDVKGWWLSQDKVNRIVYIIMLGVVLIALSSAAAIILIPKPGEYFTEFYIVGPEGLIENYPREAAIGEPLSVTIGFTNLEKEDHNYRVEVWALDPWGESQREKTAEIAPFTLAVGQTFEHPLSWTMPWAGDDQKVEFILYIDAQPEPYRQLLLWLDVLEE